MALPGRDGASRRISRVRAEIERWRSGKRRRGAPMPTRLWDAACVLARDLGVHRVTCALGLNYQSLERRVRKAEGGEVSKSPAFVELRDPHLLGAVRGTVVEVFDSGGCRLTVQLGPGSELDVAGLVEAFRRRR